ncbi:hypothetical protein NEF87_001909 [Candidatus Lokiarchaeum ossiferum]|uniref:Uncharacterized protein n=1 Tax=Candidatus Lokiarchaeum ossiferum TaxID=2951803 RepID=A0ABY6HQ39_9ARCH|nr:hypothetical protein NEF87_001909 [Candidatus Lokiarchaeum sp. B-35]
MDKPKEVQDFTHFTCTNLMLKLKILLKKLRSGENLHFFSTREQYANIEKPFSKAPYSFDAQKVEDNTYLIKIFKD